MSLGKTDGAGYRCYNASISSALRALDPSSIPLPDAGLIIGAVTLNQKMVITMNLVVPTSDTNNGQLILLNKIKDKTMERLTKAIGQ
jgi:hypothetical protein